MWLSIGYLIPMKGDKSGGGSPLPPSFYLVAQLGVNLHIQSEDGKFMVQEFTP
tara:strand:+ start:578 stop:736 length:159 start_codon:yes stop_codon:yes gene_type:complete